MDMFKTFDLSFQVHKGEWSPPSNRKVGHLTSDASLTEMKVTSSSSKLMQKRLSRWKSSPDAPQVQSTKTTKIFSTFVSVIEF